MTEELLELAGAGAREEGSGTYHLPPEACGQTRGSKYIRNGELEMGMKVWVEGIGSRVVITRMI